MATISLTQAAVYARAAGFTGDALVDVVAVVIPESSLRTDVVNGIGATGLWQINQPVHVKDHPTWTKAWLQNPANNAMAAKVIYDQQGMGAWEAWTTGRAAPYLAQARAAVAAAGGGSPTGTVTPAAQKAATDEPSGCTTVECCNTTYADKWYLARGMERAACIAAVNGNAGTSTPLDGLKSTANAATSAVTLALGAAEWVSDPSNWLRIVQVVIGGTLIIAGLNIVARPLIAPVANALPAGKVIKAAKKLTSSK